MARFNRQRINLDKGIRAEQAALHHLQREGLTLLTRNYRCRVGEIDLIMQHRQCVVFVEVRYRMRNRFSTAAYTVDGRKQAKVIRTAEFYLGRNTWLENHTVRFDVIAFDSATGERNEIGTLQWIKDAFRP